MVVNGSVFAAGQWIQFINPAGTFRIMAITGNTLTLQNAAADGITPITGNPVPPFQYGPNASFVTVAQPSQLTQAQFNEQIKNALALVESVCFNSIPEKANNEQVYMMGYVKSSLCGPTDGCCLRKMADGGPYLDEAGNAFFGGSVSAPAFNVPVPSGGIPSSNTTPINPNGGTGGGYLVAFVNPTTGATTYIDLFSGAQNNKNYSIGLSSTGVISLVEQASPFKAFALFDGTTGPACTVLNSSNVTTVTRISTGRYQITFQNPMPNVNYLVLVTVGDDAAQSFAVSGAEISSTRLTASIEIQTAASTENSSNLRNFNRINIVIF